MDLGIAGKKALVCGASAGLGSACAQALVREGVDVLIVARTEAPLLSATERLRAQGPGAVASVVADVTTDSGRARIFATQHEFDIVITNAGGPPPGDFRDWDRDIWVRALEANMLAPIALIQATVDGMMARGFGRIVNITSSAVSYYLIKSGVVPVGGSLVIVGGDQKVVLEAADVLLVVTSAATSADVVCSLLEIAP